MGAFAEQVTWARRLSKAYQKRGEHGEPEKAGVISWGAYALELGDALREAQELYFGELPITTENARHWVHDGLLPKPTKRGRGRGGGVTADYPKDFPAQAVAAVMALDQGYTRKETARARQVVLEGAPLDADFMQGVPDLLDINAFPVGYEPTIPTPRARRMADAIRFYANALAFTQAGWPMDGTISNVLKRLVDVRPGAGENTITYFVSLPGVYLDPRVANDPRAMELHKGIPENSVVRVSGGPWGGYWQAAVNRLRKD